MKTRRQYDEEFKRMAVELADAKGSLKVTAEELGITSKTSLNLVVRGKGIYLYPIHQIITKEEGESSYLRLLEQTQGSWAGDDWEKQEKKIRAVELQASKKNIQAW